MDADIAQPTAAEAAWEELRAAIERRFSYPGPAADAEVARLRDRLVVAMGEEPIGSNVIDFPSREDRRRVA